MADTVATPPNATLPDTEKMSWLMPHRVVLMAIFLGLILLAVFTMRWDWLPEYRNELLAGVGRSLLLLFSSAAVGMVFAILLGLVQVTGPKPIGWLAAGFCGIIRGTPLLLQIWLIYYGVGSIMAEHRSYLRAEWPTLFYLSRQSWIYGFAALTISFAAYEGEIMRGAFKGVPRGELEAAKAYGMGRWTMFRRIWLPRAIHRALPTLNGETVLQLKATPLVATITVMDLYGVINKIKSATLLTYEPLLLLALVYMILTAILVAGFRYFESKIPTKR